MFPKLTPKDTKAWQQLQQHYDKEIKGTHMRSIFKADPDAVLPIFTKARRYPVRLFKEYRYG